MSNSKKACIDALERFDPSAKILVLTDDENILDLIRSRHGDRVVTTNASRSNGTTGLHFEPGRNGAALGADIMVDTYLATYASKFIGNIASNVAGMITYLKDWNEGDFVVLGQSFLKMGVAPLRFSSPQFYIFHYHQI